MASLIKKYSIPRIANELLLICGASLALYLLYLKIGPGNCNTDTDCGTVIQSKYGSILGIPISIFALLFWAIIPLIRSSAWKQKNRAVTVLSWTGALGGIAFLLLQSFFINGFCPFCAAHTVVLLLFALAGAQSKGIWQSVFITIATIVTVLSFGNTETEIESLPPQTTSLPTPPKDNRDLTPGSFEWALEVTYDWKIPENEEATEIAIVSLSCHHCWDYLESLPKKPEIRPHLIIDPGTGSKEQVTLTFMESVFSQENSPNRRIAFERTLADFLKNRDDYLKDAHAYRKALI